MLSIGYLLSGRSGDNCRRFRSPGIAGEKRKNGQKKKKA